MSINDTLLWFTMLSIGLYKGLHYWHIMMHPVCFNFKTRGRESRCKRTLVCFQLYMLLSDATQRRAFLDANAKAASVFHCNKNTGSFLTPTQTRTRTQTPTQMHSSVFPALVYNDVLFYGCFIDS